MKRFLLSLLLLSLHAAINIAQTVAIDSLRNLASTGLDDTTLFNVQFALASNFAPINLDSTHRYAELNYKLAQKLGDHQSKAEANHIFTLLYLKKNQPALALPYSLEAKEYYRIINDSSALLKSMNLIGGAYLQMGKYPQALEQFYETKIIAMSRPAWKPIAVSVLSNIGLIELNLGDSLRAKQTYLEGLELYNNEVAPKHEQLKSSILNGLSNAYNLLKEYDKAIEIREEQIQLTEKLNDPRGKGIALINLFMIYKDTEQFELAEETAFEAEQLLVETGAQNYLANLYWGIADLEFKRGNFTESTSFGEKALKIFQEITDIASVSGTHEFLSEAYDSMDRHEIALQHFKSYYALHDSLDDVKLEEKIQELNTKYETKEKEEENILLTIKNQTLKLERNILLLSSILFLAFLATLIYLIRKIKKQKDEIEKNNQLKNKLFTIVAHDLRSPLLSMRSIAKKINYLIKENREEEIMEMGNSIENDMNNVNQLLDNFLKWAMTQGGRFPHRPELLNLATVLKEVTAVYKSIADAKKIKLDVQVEDGTSIFFDKNALTTIVRNLVDNAIKFTDENGEINLFVNNDESGTSLFVKDNGIGMKKEKINKLFEINNDRKEVTEEQGTGIGLALCKELVELNNGKINVESQPGDGTTFKIVFPAHN
ncbi:MAG: ATP-binding protein [Bacteroidota bacterium]